MSRPLRIALVLLLGAACSDPLYEEGAPLLSSWVICCRNGAIDTCQCNDQATCKTTFFPCAGGRCSPSPSCFAGTGGGAGGSGGGAAGGAGGGSPQDAGVGGGAGGGGGGGAGGGTGGGGFVSWEFCCTSGAISTCACPNGVCTAPAFTPCAGGACVTSGSCR